MIKQCVDYIYDDEDNKFPPIRSFFLLGGVLMYLVNTGLNAWVAYEYLLAKEAGLDAAAGYYLTATLVFIAFPVVAVNVLSWGLYTWCYLLCASEAARRYWAPWRGGASPDSRLALSSKVAISPTWEGEEGDGRNPVALSSPVESPTPTKTDGETPPPKQGEAETAFFATGCGEKWEKEKDEEGSSKTEGDSSSDHTDVHVEFYALDPLGTREYALLSGLHLLLLGYESRALWLFCLRKADRYSFERYRDLSFLRLMTAFMQAAPQTVLQLYISILTPAPTPAYSVVTPLSITVSMVTLALAVADYVSACKDVNFYGPLPDHPKKDRMTWTSYVIFILWHLAMIAGRSVVFALFASVYGEGLLIVLGLHYAGMVYWMYRQHAEVFLSVRTRDDKSITVCRMVFDPRQHLLRNYGIEFIVAVFNTFFHFKLQELSTVESAVTFYSIAFVENTILVLMWYMGRDYSAPTWYDHWALVLVFFSFVIGLGLMVLYYKVSRKQGEFAESLSPLKRPALTSSLNWLYRHNMARRDSTMSTLLRKLFKSNHDANTTDLQDPA